MAQSTPLKVHHIYSVAPPEGTTATSLSLTFFDLLWLRYHPVERLFFYEFPNPTTTTTSFFDTIVPNLKHSLELTLQHFIPLAGNITWPLHSHNPIINYVLGDSVPFTIAESNADFNHLCSNLCEAKQRYPLVPHLTMSHEQASVLALQVTLFPNFGFCIGITTHHAAVDGKSSTSFMKSWAYACSMLIESQSSSLSLSLPQHLTPFFDRLVIRDPTGIAEAYVDAWLKQGGQNNRSLKVLEWFSVIQAEAVKGLFELTPSHISKLKQYAQFKLKTKVHLSTFSVTCAYVIACLVKAEQTKANSVVFVYNVDCRSRLEPPIPSTYFGNCVGGGSVVTETTNLLGNDGFINALEGIIEGLNRVLVKDGVLNGAETWVSAMQTSKEAKILSVSGSPRFEVYGVDFGWGRPIKVDITSSDKTGAFSLAESKNNNGGIEIGLVLNKQEMEDFADHFAHTLESFGSFETIE